MADGVVFHQPLLARRYGECLALAVWLRRHWLACLLVMALYGGGQHWLYVNWSASLPYRLVWIEYGALPNKGDLIIFRFDRHPFQREDLASLRFFKRVAGVPGDRVDVVGRRVSVAGQLIGDAKRRTSFGGPLTPAMPGLVPPGFVFAQSDTVDSFDSRYAEFGLVSHAQILGVAHVVF